MSTDTRENIIHTYLALMLCQNSIFPSTTFEEACLRFNADVSIILALYETCYLNGRDHKVPKASQLPLAWQYVEDPQDHNRFTNMFRVSPYIFNILLQLIQFHPIFTSQSNVSQAPVEVQLAVTLFRMGRYGNGASIQDIARQMGCSEGSVENYTNRCFDAIASLEEVFVRKLSDEEKEREKQWVDNELGFKGAWRDGWLMYDGTIVVLYQRPGLNGDAYFTRKHNYGLDVQIGNAPSNLRIVDYSHGHTGSCHDARAFEHTAASRYPDWLFDGNEFAWADSAYPFHKEPASTIPQNAIFDRYAARLRVRSEHTMGALKGRLRLPINTKKEHVAACRWVTIAIILHNLIVDFEGPASVAQFLPDHMPHHEAEDTEPVPDHSDLVLPDGEAKRQMLVDVLLEWRKIRDSNIDN
ncbi:hypothetical protein H0H93_009567 [Arthromyces matolae]|nr:hypothetical protein H0H93_009567 [Arthromyces matolae]